MESAFALFLLFVVGPVVLALGIVNGALMCASPRLHARFLRWYTRSESQMLGADSGPQIEFRIAGFIILVVCIFLAWILAEKILILKIPR